MRFLQRLLGPFTIGNITGDREHGCDLVAAELGDKLGVVPAAIHAAAIEAFGLAGIENLAQTCFPVLHAYIATKLLGRLADDCLGG